MNLRDGVLWITWARNTSVGDADARAVTDRTNALSAGARLPMLVEVAGIETLTRNALIQFAKELNITAMALAGPSLVDNIIAAHFTEIYHPLYPTRYFSSCHEALTWLSRYSHVTRGNTR
jgi:hypothetical protein